MSDELPQKLLHLVEQVRDEARERDKRIDARFTALEHRLEDLSRETHINTKHIGEQAAALTRVAQAAAHSADLALEAKRDAQDSKNEAARIVEGALRIHGTSIVMTVDEAVKKAVQPLAADVETLKLSDKERALVLSNQDDQLRLVVALLSKLARWQSHWAVKVGLAVGAAIAGFLAARH